MSKYKDLRRVYLKAQGFEGKGSVLKCKDLAKSVLRYKDLKYTTILEESMLKYKDLKEKGPY